MPRNGRIALAALAFTAVSMVAPGCSSQDAGGEGQVGGQTSSVGAGAFPSSGGSGAAGTGGVPSSGGVAGSGTPTTSGGVAGSGNAPSSGGTTAGSGPSADSGSGGVQSGSGGAQSGSGGTHSGAGGADSGLGGADSGFGGSAGGDAVEELIGSFDAYWDFETVEGSTVPSSVGDAALELDAGTAAPGPTGNQLALSDSAAGAHASDSILDTAESFSIATWLRLDELTEYNTVVSIDGSQVSAVYLQKRADHRLALATFPEDSTASTPCVTSAEVRPRPGEWYHVVATRDRASRAQRLYVDGVLSGMTVCPDGVFSASGPLRVGSGRWDGTQRDFVSGAIDELGVVSRVLSPRDALALYRAGRPQARHYLFAYFVEVSQGRGDGLRLAHSHDGLHWGAIGAGKVFMPPSVGGGSFRDPHVMRDPEGVYHLVWTTSCVPWAESNCVQDRGFGHATSRDLVTWSAADYVPIDLNVEHVWAPETVFDPLTQQYMIVFSAPIDANPSAADPHSLYYVLTSDFESFSPPELLYSRPGRNVIDGTISRVGDEFLMILKDEAEGQKNLRALVSPSLFGEGAWQDDPSAPLTGNYAAEGPSIMERDGQLLIYFDKYAEGAYGALRAAAGAPLTSPSSWEDISSSTFFPGVRHGTPIEVPGDVFEKVALFAGE